MRKLKQMKANFNGENIQFLTSYFDMPSTLELYYQIAIEKIDLLKMRGIKLENGNFVIQRVRTPQPEPGTEKPERKKRKRRKSEEDIILFGDNSEKLAYEFATCCAPIPGDDVLGFVSVGKGVKIHRSSCPNAINMASKYGYRIIKTEWASAAKPSFLAGIKLTGTDDMGLINKLTSIISNEFKVNMKSLSLETRDNVFDGEIKLYVKNNEQLSSIITKLKSLEGIIGVQRMELAET